MTTITEPKSSADYQSMLLGLAKNTTPEPELEKALSAKPSDSSAWRNPLAPEPKSEENKEAVETAIKTIYRLAGIVQGTLQSEILSRTTAITKVEASVENTPEETRKELQEKAAAATLLCALQPRKPGKGELLQNWEATSRAMSLSDLKARTIIRTCLASEDIFSAVEGSPELKKNLEDGIKLFREASRSFEISLAAKNNTQAGPGKAATHVRNIPPKGLEIISCLAQIAIECVRNSSKELPEVEEASLRGFQANCRRAFGIAYSANQSTEDSQRKSVTQIQGLLSENLLETAGSIQDLHRQWENWKTQDGENLAQEPSKVLSALFSEIPMSDANKNLLESVSEQSSQSDYLEEETTEKEWVTVRQLEKIYNRFEKELQPIDGTQEHLLKSDAPISLRVFAAFRREAGELGKASTMVLAGKILGDATNLASFKAREKNNEGDILSVFPSIQKTRLIQQEAGRTLQATGFGPDERNMLEELSEIADNLDYAKNLLFSKPVIRTLHAKERTAAEAAAKKIMDGGPAESDMEKSIQKIHAKVSDTTRTLESEIETNSARMDKIPGLLRDQEASRTLNGAVGRLLRTAESSRDQLQAVLKGNYPDPVKNAAATLLEISEKSTSEEGITNPDLADISKRLSPTSVKSGSLGTLISNLADRRGSNGAPTNLEDLAKILLLENQEKAEAPMQEDAAKLIVNIETQRNSGDNEAPFAKIKTADLAEIVRLTGNKTAEKQLLLRAQNRFLRDLRTIRRWKDKTNGMDKEEAKTLAVELCRMSATIKKSCGSQMRKNIEEACQPPVWNDHSSMSQEELDKSFAGIKQSYSVLRATFKRENSPTEAERELLGIIQRIQTLTEEIHGKNPGKWVQAEELAASLADKGELRTCQLQAIKKLMDIPQGSPLTEPSVEFLQCWSNYTGNREALLKTAILLPKELKNVDKLDTAEYLASTIETHSTNLKELLGYMKAVCENPQALAETYLQHDRNQNPEKTEVDPAPNTTWKESMLKEAEATSQNAKSLDEEIEAMTHLFEAKIQEANEMEEGIEKEEFLDPRFHRAFDSMISQKEKELQRLLLKENRIRKLVQMAEGATDSPTIKAEKAKNPQEPAPEESVENTLAKALDLALTATRQKLALPKRIQPSLEVEANEILDASMAHKKVALCRETLVEVTKRLRENNPKVQSIIDKLDAEDANLPRIYREIKEVLFESVMGCEILAMQTRRNPGDVNPELKALKNRLMADNHLLEEEQRKWVAVLTRTARQLEKSIKEIDAPKEIEAAKEKKPRKTKAPAEKAPSEEELVKD